MKIAQMLQALNWNEVMEDLDNISAQLEAENLAHIKRVRDAARARRVHRAIENGERLISRKIK